MTNRYKTIQSDEISLAKVKNYFLKLQIFNNRMNGLPFYLFLCAIVTSVLFWRFPNNFTNPNFYGEDGSVYLQNILSNGWLSAITTPFNGYFIVGLYLLCGLGWIINALFFGGDILTLPAAFTLSAMLFMSAVICLPYILFRKKLGRNITLLVVLWGAMLPLPMSPHIVIGTIGNQKWIFFYLAFLLIIFRIWHKNLTPRKYVLIDFLVAICAYTNATTYLLVPLIFTPYLVSLATTKKMNITKRAKFVLQQKGFKSASIFTLLLIPQIIYVGINGIPEMPGYLDTPFNPSRAIELLVNRTYLFGATHIVNGYMNDLLSVILVSVGVILTLKYVKRGNRLLIFAGLYASTMATLLFTLNRPGVTDFFFGYSASGSGPDQFFYTQTLIMYLPIVLLISALIQLIRNHNIRISAYAMLVVYIVASGVLSNNIYGELWRNASVFENDAGTFIDNAIISCKKVEDVDASDVAVTVYPYSSGQFSLLLNKEDICTDNLLSSYQPSVVQLGLVPNNNNFLAITNDTLVTQTFTADKDNLNGIRIFISNFGLQKRDGQYRLLVKDVDCTDTLRSVVIPEILIDSSYYNARFASIADSGGTSYCIQLDAPDESQYDVIAIQRSKPNIYLDGIFTENGEAKYEDMVFAPLYSQEK